MFEGARSLSRMAEVFEKNASKREGRERRPRVPVVLLHQLPKGANGLARMMTEAGNVGGEYQLLRT